MKKLKKNLGMTMAEMLIVVAIIAVLGGVASVAVWNYQRSLGQLERDGIAKEIFVAAQNHLTAAHGQGYLGLSGSDFGTEDTTSTIVGDYYYVVNGGASGAGVFKQMLPFGSVDETVRAGGSYIIHYQKDTGLVLDVFYCTRNGSPAQFNVASLVDGVVGVDGDYTYAMNARGSKEDRKTGAWRKQSNGPILGYYGGTDAATLPTTTLQTPTINVVNAEKLYVEVTDKNKRNSSAKLKLIVTGVDSKAQVAFELTPDNAVIDARMDHYSVDGIYTVTLDDITTSGMHFGNINAATGTFNPGENIEIQAVAYSTSALANIAYSAKNTTNSLFGGINGAQDSAYIGNIRHLENLDKAISNLDANDSNDNKLKISHAVQTDSFSWITFQKENKKIESKATNRTESDEGYAAVGVYDFSGTSTVKTDSSGSSSVTIGYYMPIEPNYKLTYDGKSHSISDVSVDIEGDAGLFGSTSSVTEIKNLELIDFSIIGTSSAGALAGTLSNASCKVTNVLARNSSNKADVNISAPTSAGGLIGSMNGGAVNYSAAAVIVSATGTSGVAGGLIGASSGEITGCYSGGHTASGSYEKWGTTTKDGVTSKTVYDVTGSTAGGLVGNYTGEKIENSYSTCSVSGTTAGGFMGSESGSITNCYATGLVSGADRTKIYAFLGSGDATLSENYYYQVINEVEKTENGKTVTEPMQPFPSEGEVSSRLSATKPIDLNADTYNAFVGAWDDWNPARAYDASLVKYYSGRYTLKTVDELQDTEKPTDYENWNQLFVKTHYGDWPSPEVFFINN